MTVTRTSMFGVLLETKLGLSDPQQIQQLMALFNLVASSEISDLQQYFTTDQWIALTMSDPKPNVTSGVIHTGVMGDKNNGTV